MGESFVFDKYGKISIQGDIKGILKNDLMLFESLIYKNKETLDSLNLNFIESNVSIKSYIINYIEKELAEMGDF